MPDFSFLAWPFLEESYRCSADDYEDTSEIQKLIIAAHVLRAVAGESDAG